MPPNTVFSGFGECGADHTANETACKRAHNIENALISQTPLQLMFGGCGVLRVYRYINVTTGSDLYLNAIVATSTL